MPQGSWSTIEVAGHACDVFEPAEPRQPERMVMYLHGRHVTRLADNAVFTGEFERHGLRVIAPQTARSWWSDKILAEFDARFSAEHYVIDEVMPAIAERWGV